MSRNRRNIWASGIAAGLVAFASIVFPALLHGFDAGKPSPTGKLVVHEWGTFTNFSGSDGVNLEFRPLVTSDLPRFIMTPFNQPGSPGRDFGKNQFYARQRMETPVTYFYTDQPRTVNVRVDFPQGALTEWYPVVKKFQSGKADNSLDIVGRAYLDWGTVRLTPSKQFADIRVHGPKKKAVPASLPPVDANDHYGRARETDSAIVETVDTEHGSHFEKFLFYRGLGNFELPMKLGALGNDRFEITNSGDEASGALLLMRIDNGLVRFTRIDPIRARSASEVALPETESTVDQLTEATLRELTAAGLYEKESMAMVNTWRTSWFGENGTRLLYLVPSKQTDKLLPLKVDPAPDVRVRVLVGRLETITPEDCKELVRKLAGNSANEKPSDERVKEELKLLGRFAEPAIKFAIGQTGDVATRKRLEVVLAKVHAREI
jgi:hypothetical protein